MLAFSLGLLASAAAASAPAFISFPGGPRSICGLGDVNGDGCADIAVGVRRADRGGSDAGAIYVVSGKTGKQLAERIGPAPCLGFGTCLASVHDINGDGTRDFAVGAPNWTGYRSEKDPCKTDAPGSVFLLSGKDASILEEWKSDKPGDRFGCVLDAAGDFDGDALNDLIVGAPGSGDAHVVSGKDGHRILSVASGRSVAEWDMSVCALRDVDLDGKPDFAVGYPHQPVAGCVRVHSGKDGKLIERIEPGELAIIPNSSPPGPYTETRFGCSLAFVPDFEGEGKSVMLIGADRSGSVGKVCVHSLSKHTCTMTLIGTEWIFSRFGSSLDLLGDVNGDGRPDFLIANPDDDLGGPTAEHGQAPGSVAVFSGKTGEALYAVHGDKQFDRLGYAVAACGDMNGDGVPDFVAEALDRFFRAYSGKDGKVLFQFDPPKLKPAVHVPEEKR